MNFVGTDFETQTKNVVLVRILMAVFIFVITVLQSTVIRGIEVFNAVPNLLFITVICYSLLCGDYSAIAFGVVCGLLLDITGGRIVGLNTLLCTFAAYFCICVSGNLFNNNAFVSMVFVLLLSIPYELITYLLYFAIWGHGSFFYALLAHVLPAALYNFVVTLLVHPIVRKIVT